MSASKLKNALGTVVSRIEERRYKNNPKNNDKMARSIAEKNKGQFFIINESDQKSLIATKLGIELTDKEMKTMFAKIKRFLNTQEKAHKYAGTADYKDHLKQKREYQRVHAKPGDFVSLVSNFERAKTLKVRGVKEDGTGAITSVSQIQADFINKKLAKEGRERKVTKTEVSSLTELGHGDRSVSISQFNVDRAVQIAVEQHDLGVKEEEILRTIVTKQREKHRLKYSLSHSQYLDSKGGFRKSFRYVITNQDKDENRKDKEIEENVARDSIQDFKHLEMETSTRIEDAVQQLTLHHFAKNPLKNKKIRGKHRRKISEKSTAEVKTTRIESSYMAFSAVRNISLDGVRKKQKRKAPGRQTGTKSFSNLSLVAIINAKLNSVVEKNMQAPALESRTGRFASSVRVTDITKTRKGYPSVGYAYQTEPYQIYEMGRGSPPWATRQRDPRRLIDKSIREIMAEHAIGRFYTRRL